LLSALYVAFVSSVFSYPITLVIGWPVYLILKNTKIFNIWVIGILGLPIGLLLPLIFNYGSTEELDWVYTFGVCGLFVSATAAYIAKDEIKSNKSFESDA